MKPNFKFSLEIALLLVIVSLIFILGWQTNAVYRDIKIEREINGLYIKGNIDMERAKEIAEIRDKKGDWVCINVAYDMKPSEAYQTCVHECSHKAYTEIFAEWCEDDFEKCLGVVENE